MAEVCVWTTGIACWGDDVYIRGWVHSGNEIMYLLKLFPGCTVRVDHYDPDPTRSNGIDQLFYTTDRVTSRFHNEALDPSTLPVDSILYDYAHILNPVARADGLRYITQHHYTDHPISDHDDLQLKVVYHGYTGIEEPNMLLRLDKAGLPCTMYDRLFSAGVSMDGTVGLQELLPPLYRDRQRECQRRLREIMPAGAARLEAMDRSDKKIFMSVIEQLWN